MIIVGINKKQIQLAPDSFIFLGQVIFLAVAVHHHMGSTSSSALSSQQIDDITKKLHNHFEV